MITLSYWQFAMVFFWPTYALGIYILLKRGAQGADHWRYALDQTSDQLSKILDLFMSNKYPSTLFLTYKTAGKWPEYDQHYKALREGKDVALLYPELIRDDVYKICYGDVWGCWQYMKTTEPKAWKRWMQNYAVRQRMIGK